MKNGGIKLELEYVQRVYEQIAERFSETRYKVWPVVNKFLGDIGEASLVGGGVTTKKEMPWIGLDIGCGNGKNMLACSSNVCVFGIDL